MARTPIAAVMGLAGLAAYLMAVVAFADRLVGAAWPLQVAYFLAAGIAWVIPARWLILWAARRL